MLKKIKNYSAGEIILIIGIVTLIVLTMSYVVHANNNANRIYDSVSTTTAVAVNTVKIVTDPSGISMQSEKYCDSTKLNKKTPFSCSIPKSVDNIIVTAPEDFTRDSKKYVFKEWLGCSNGTTVKTECIVNFPAKDAIKATYSESKKTAATLPPSPAEELKPNCNGTVVNDNKSCRFEITYDDSRMPGRLSAVPIQKYPNRNIYDELTITGLCSTSGACTTYDANQTLLTGPYTKDRIDLSITKPTKITVDAPMTKTTGSSGDYYLLNGFVYSKAAYANGGGGTYFDSLTIEYTLQHKL
jgi:hypothetical protein